MCSIKASKIRYARLKKIRYQHHKMKLDLSMHVTWHAMLKLIIVLFSSAAVDHVSSLPTVTKRSRQHGIA